MLGSRQPKSSYVIGNKGSVSSQRLGVKYSSPSNNPQTLTVGTTGISNNEQQSIYDPVGLRQPKELNSKKYNSLEKFKR
jgi:hypothetical protein